MIPQFPEFKKLELSDREEIESFTKKFPPYSDFNFVSMWSWDVRGEMRVSWLNGNLVVKFSHYLTVDSFLSFIGTNMVNETAEVLIQFSKINNEDTLKLVPEITANLINKDIFDATIEDDQADYIYDLQYISAFSGGHFASKRTAINKLTRENPTLRTEIVDLDSEMSKFNLKKVNISWIQHKTAKDPYGEIQNELIAIDRFLSNNFGDKIICIGVYINDQMVGYHMVEIVSQNYAICHYIKADFSHSGIYDFLMKESARILLEKGVKYINFEQDLGLPGLKSSKERFSTGIFLEKYKIMLK